MILTRIKLTKKYTLGVLTDDKGGTYFTCENTQKLIPEGEYSCELTPSPKFKKVLPLLTSSTVGPERGIRIHQGNSAEDSEGCVLVGNVANLEFGTIGNSQKAMEQLQKNCGKTLVIRTIQK